MGKGPNLAFKGDRGKDPIKSTLTISSNKYEIIISLVDISHLTKKKPNSAQVNKYNQRILQRVTSTLRVNKKQLPAVTFSFFNYHLFFYNNMVGLKVITNIIILQRTECKRQCRKTQKSLSCNQKNLSCRYVSSIICRWYKNAVIYQKLIAKYYGNISITCMVF